MVTGVEQNAMKEFHDFTKPLNEFMIKVIQPYAVVGVNGNYYYD